MEIGREDIHKCVCMRPLTEGAESGGGTWREHTVAVGRGLETRQSLPLISHSGTELLTF